MAAAKTGAIWKFDSNKMFTESESALCQAKYVCTYNEPQSCCWRKRTSQRVHQCIEKNLVHFIPKHNEIFERATFHSRVQNATESVEPFIRQLYKLEENCNFGCNCGRIHVQREQCREK